MNLRQQGAVTKTEPKKEEGMRMKPKDLLSFFIPYKYMDAETLINACGRMATGEDAEKELAKTKRAIKALVDKKYVAKKVLYQKRNRSGSEKRKWAIEPYDESKRWAREHGYKIYVLTKAGFEVAIENIDTDFGNMIRRQCEQGVEWIDNSKRTRNYNYTRQRANIYTYMSLAGVDVPGEKRVKPISGIKEDNKQVKTVPDVICEAMKSTMSLLPDNAVAYFADHPTLYMKEEIGGDMGKNIGKDNIIALLVTAKELFPIYHTSDYYGTAWVLRNKKETSVTLANFAYSVSHPTAAHNRALIFASNLKEFADLILSSHMKPTETDRPFGPYKSRSIKLETLAKPYESLYAIPECEATIDHLKYLLFDGEATPFEDTLSALLEDYDSEARYSEMSAYSAQTRFTPYADCLTFPEDELERFLFQEDIFPFVAFLTDDNRLATPIFDGRDMDLNRISRAYHFCEASGYIGNIMVKNKLQKNLIIICFPWQVSWYKKIFYNSIFIY